MISRDHDAWESEAGVVNQESERRPPGTRRALLGAAGGFALAASGLLVPNWLMEAEAREGALDDARGGRRSNDHRGRHRKRTHGDKRGKPRGGGPLNPRPFTFLVDVYGEHSPVKADFYSTKLRPGAGDDWQLTESKQLTPPAGSSVATAEIKAAVWLEDRLVISANARVQGVRIGHGGDFWAGYRGWQGGNVVFDDGLEVQEITQAFVMEGYRIRV